MSRPVAATLRRGVPLLVLPLALVACVLASTPWLRAFPANVMAVPLVGTALISVLLPVVVIAIGVRWLWLTALIDLAGFVFFTTLLTLRDPLSVSSLWDGLIHGPSQILTFALPLVEPRTLLVAPIALCWVCGAVIGECIGRGWNSLLPFAAALVTFGLAYGATTRAITNAADGRRYDTVLAALLLLTLLLLRVTRAWLEQDEGTDDSEPGSVTGVLPLARLGRGVVAALAVALVAALVVQSSAFSGPPATTSRVTPLDTTEPVTPLSFVAGLRPEDSRATGQRLFGVSFDQQASRYVALADVDTYDGDSWRFDREFRPSGGMVPADPDPTMRPRGAAVTQRYTIADGPLTDAPWLPFQYRPQNIRGVPVNIDPTSGMIVPRTPLHRSETYTVVSATPRTGFDALPPGSLAGTSAPPSATALPLAVQRSIGTVVTSLENETGTQSASPLMFLRAVQQDFRKNYALSGGPAEERTNVSAAPSASTSTGASPTPSRTDSPRSGGSGFAAVLASILGAGRAATPEQYATLTALLARARGVPARVVTGFRIGTGSGSTVPAGTYDVTARQAWTWVEIPVQGRGWVVLDASPTSYADQRPAPSVTARPTPSPSPSSSNALVTQAPADNGNAVAPSSDVPTTRTPSLTAWLLAAVIVVALLLIAVAALVWRKRRRVRRRRRGGARLQVIGAWQETLDVLAESGLGELDSLTSAEVAAAAARRFGTDIAANTKAVGDAANVAIFSPTSHVDAGAAASAWQGTFEVRRRIRRGQSVRQRVGSGLRYHRGRARRRRSVARGRLRS